MIGADFLAQARERAENAALVGFAEWYQDRDFGEVKISNSRWFDVPRRGDREQIIKHVNLVSASASDVPYLLAMIQERDRKLKIAEDALAWEDRRCGRVYGPLGDALKELRGEK